MIKGVTFQESVGFLNDDALSDMTWDKFLDHLNGGEDNTSTIQIWDSIYEPQGSALRLYVECTPTKDKFFVWGEYLEAVTGEWEPMNFQETVNWLTDLGIQATPVYGGGGIICMDEIKKIPDAVASMKKGFVKEVIESL